MKEFLLLFIGGNEWEEALSPEQMQAYMQEWFDWIGQMTEQGIYIGGNPLKSEGKTLSGKEKVVTDGPFAEAKEVIGGYVAIKVEAMDDAVEAAKGCPIFSSGGRVEVRPIGMHD